MSVKLKSCPFCGHLKAEVYYIDTNPYEWDNGWYSGCCGSWKCQAKVGPYATKEEAIEAWKTVLEPACGEGAFLADILRRKLARVKPGSDEAFLALASLYGVEIQADNVAACRRRLLDIFRPWALDIADEHTAAWILGWNIVQGDFLKGADMDGAPIMFNVYAIRNGKFAVIGRERLFPPGQEPVRAMEPYRRKRRKA